MSWILIKFNWVLFGSAAFIVFLEPGFPQGSCPPPSSTNFRSTTLINIPAGFEPMDMRPAEGKIFWIGRHGVVMEYNTEGSTTRQILDLETSSEEDEQTGPLRATGLLSMALDPDFSQNNWVYLFYCPPGNSPAYRISRFTYGPEGLAQEKPLLEIEGIRYDRDHTGGGMDFGPGGNLYIAIGDNTTHDASDGFSPLDERPGEEINNAQRTSANTHDLRGKILRIKPLPFANEGTQPPGLNSTYRTPTGNLVNRFPNLWNQEERTKIIPEIYTLGHRNPFKISTNPLRGWVLVGEVGPDALTDNSSRGPMGHEEWNLITSPGFYGWPYFIGNNQPYVEYDFATQTSGAVFNASAPENHSPGNTGVISLPPARGAAMWLTRTNELHTPAGRLQKPPGSGSTAMGGDFYYYYESVTRTNTSFPPYYNGKLFVTDFAQGWIQILTLSPEGNIIEADHFLPNLGMSRIIDIKFGTEGALYVLEWGSSYQPNNSGAAIHRIDYTGPQVAPESCGVTGIQASKSTHRLSTATHLIPSHLLPEFIRQKNIVKAKVFSTTGVFLGHIKNRGDYISNGPKSEGLYLIKFNP